MSDKLSPRQIAGELILNWVEESTMIEFDADDDTSQMYYNYGWNDCRSEIMRLVADVTLDSECTGDCAEVEEGDDDLNVLPDDSSDEDDEGENVEDTW